MNLKHPLLKNGIVLLTLLSSAVWLLRCSDDDKPKTIPQVITHDATDVQTNSATLNGEIQDNGNASIEESGFVYSSVVATPTLNDDKIEVTADEGELVVLLEGLSSGTIYHVRAYATNSVGTGYGDVVDVSTDNAAPTVTNVTLTGDLEANKEVSVSYTYSDAEGDAQGATVIQWYSANDDDGAGEVLIAGATEMTYTIPESLQDKYIRVSVTPKAATGTTTGEEVKTLWAGAIGEATTVTFMYNGNEVTYGIIVSTTTGKKWLDRNLGATAIASSVDDYAHYGHLFQWGRLDDGHQVISRSGPTDAEAVGVNGTTSLVEPYETSSTDIPGHNKFIVAKHATDPSPQFYDWRMPQNNNLWQGSNAINNPCPDGWHIPTTQEWAAENILNIDDGFSRFKFTYSGFRLTQDASFSSSALGGYYWSSTIDPANTKSATRIRLNSSGYNALPSTNRGGGYACRCVKD